jgi:hypothetical protein
MPVYSRRRIQQMLDELSGIIRPSHFIGRLNDKRFENAIPAEAELGLVWAANALGGFESEPAWFSDSNKRPEGISDALVPGVATVFDVKAISDRVIPGNVGMRKISRKLMEAANKAKKGTGNKLDFFFYERRDYENLGNHRAICAPPHYAPSPSVISTIGDFVRSHPKEGQHIDISDGGMNVRVTWKSDVSKLFNFRSSTVNEIFDIHDNHIAAALREKAKQMRSANFAGLRGVLLADIGCASLKQINGIDQLGRSFSGRNIIQHYLDNSKSALDFVCVFSPKHERSFMANTHYYWQVTVIVKQGLDMPMSGLQALASKLPAPRFDGYALEHLHEQQLFRDQARGWYVGANMTTKSNPDSELNVKFSARALHEFLAGRITGDRLRDLIIGGAGAFDFQLAKGNTIREAKVISGGIDEDDDYIELVFAPDAAASPFK